MGILEMDALWKKLQKQYRSGTIKKREEQIYDLRSKMNID